MDLELYNYLNDRYMGKWDKYKGVYTIPPSLEWRQLKKFTLWFWADDHIGPYCLRCGAIEDNLLADHVYPRHKFWLLHNDICNTQTLCWGCNGDKLRFYGPEWDFRKGPRVGLVTLWSMWNYFYKVFPDAPYKAYVKSDMKNTLRQIKKWESLPSSGATRSVLDYFCDEVHSKVQEINPFVLEALERENQVIECFSAVLNGFPE